MMLPRHLAVIATVVLGTLGPTSAAHGFACSRTGRTVGPSLYWNQLTVSWYAHPSSLELVGDVETGEAEIRSAFDAWSNQDCTSLGLVYRGETLDIAGFDNRVGAFNQNVLMWVAPAAWPYDDGAIAITTTAYDTQTGVLVDADIELNGGFTFARVIDGQCNARQDTMDLRNTLTHEVGHFIGLDHPPRQERYEDVTMFASAPPCEIKKRTLEADDIEGICSIYPAGAAIQPCFPSERSGSPDEGSNGFLGCRHTAAGPSHEWGWGSVGWLGLVFAGWWCRRRRFRK